MLQERDTSLWEAVKNRAKEVAGKIRAIVDAYKDERMDSREGKVVANMKEILPQLEELYGKGQLDALLAGCQTRICFRTEDEASRDFIKKDCGKVLCSTVRYIPGFSMTPGAPELKDAVSDTELTTLPRGCAIVSEPGEVPYRIQLDP